MSRRHNRPGRTTPPRPKATDAAVRQAAELSCRLNGCTCDEVELSLTDNAAGYLDLAVRHDNDCPVLRRKARRWN